MPPARVEGVEQLAERLLRCDVPTVIALVGPGVVQMHTLETPDQPTTFDVDQVLDQFDGRPSGRQPTGP